ncbi:ABC transporter ATP-binding protein [Blautia schinkii]|nr:ABC transporter ATP-binding protein [Blautia schinkii]
MLKVSSVNKSYREKQVLKNLDFTIEKGHAVGFVGPNGAGKSTTMNIITGYLQPSCGAVEIDGISQLTDMQAYKSKFGYLPEIPPLYVEMVVEDYLEFVFEAKKLKGSKSQEVLRVMDKLGITHVRGRLIKHLSKGYKQRIGFAQALLGNPPVLILDEPTIGLDPGQIIQVRNLLLELKKEHTILISSHILSEISEVCDEIIFIYEGEIMAFGKPEELIKQFFHRKVFEIVTENCKKSCIEEIRGILGVTDVSLYGRDAEEERYRVEYDGEQEIRNELFRILMRHGTKLYELKEIKDSLESVFLKLIQRQVP